MSAGSGRSPGEGIGCPTPVFLGFPGGSAGKATGISWSSLGGLKGVKPPEAFGERSRDWSLGHTGDEGP